MNELTKLIDEYSAASNIDELFGTLQKYLHEKCGASSLFYGLVHSLKRAQEVGVVESGWHKSNHPEEFITALQDNDFIDLDRSVMHCLTSVSPFVWHDMSNWQGLSKKEKEYLYTTFDCHMEVGVSVPERFGRYGLGGVGICAANISGPEFDRLWKQNREEIISACHLFNSFACKEYMDEIFHLTPREREVLTWLVAGKGSASEIADILGTSASTVEKQIRSARRSLKANSNEEAVAKALIFGLIDP